MVMVVVVVFWHALAPLMILFLDLRAAARIMHKLR